MQISYQGRYQLEQKLMRKKLSIHINLTLVEVFPEDLREIRQWEAILKCVRKVSSKGHRK